MRMAEGMTGVPPEGLLAPARPGGKTTDMIAGRWAAGSERTDMRLHLRRCAVVATAAYT